MPTENLRRFERTVHEAASYFLWFYTPFLPMTARSIYELVSTNAFTAEGLYLNLGYWKDAPTIDDACQALVRLVADTAHMGPGDDVVDVGYGFADQDVLWMRSYAPRGIVGFNVTPSQVRLARERVQSLGLADRIDLREGSATETGLPDASCDVVTAVECAFHFNTRESFFAEALRILRPGGRLVLADVIPNAPPVGRWRSLTRRLAWSIAAKKFAVPSANGYDRIIYADKLRAAGFDEIEVTSIRNEVFFGWHRALAQDPALLRRFHVVGRASTNVLIRLDPNAVYDGFDYVIASATKPL
jgi:ubiquinone/menaquinone biosynthesis C-methylase UbiE